MSGRLILSFVVTTLVVFLVSCTPGPLVPADLSATISVTRPVMPTATPLPTLQSPPSYILNTKPAAASTLSWDEYTSGEDASAICVEFDEGALIFKFREGGFIAPDENFAYEDLASHVSLVVNGRKILYLSELFQVTTLTQVMDEDGNVLASYGGPATACWHVELDPGTHEAEFQFWHTSSVVESYRWYFALTEGTPEPSPTPVPTATPAPLPTIWPLPTAEPMPNSIYQVYPEPAAVLTLQTEHPPVASEIVFRNEICVGVNIPSLSWLRPGVWSITLNGTKFDEPGRLAFIDEYLVADEPEETAEAEEKVGTIEPCWELTGLQPGSYEASFQMETPSGALRQYRWFFTLTEP
jgi:hypothetical protein